jgi:hypothetical protein
MVIAASTSQLEEQAGKKERDKNRFVLSIIKNDRLRINSVLSITGV